MKPLENIQLAFQCPKLIDELKPCDGGWYCDGCRKIVHDFRGICEEEILNTFKNSDQSLCGMYEADRIRVLPQKPKWYKWLSAAMVLIGLTACHDEVMGKVIKTQQQPARRDTVKQKEIDQNTVMGFVAVSINPAFPGGEEALKKYIKHHVKNTVGHHIRASVQFTIERDGSVTHVNMVKSAGREIDSQIITAVKNMPKWTPTIKAGKPERLQYTMPISMN